MRLLAISGSLRNASLNTAALEAAAHLAPADVEIVLYARLADLPLYNFDLDADTVPEPVAHLRRHVAACDGLLIASPEYAHGIAAPMKNALDWLVGDVAFPNKPVALWNTSPRAVHAQAHLREVLATMSARIVERASLALPLLGRPGGLEGLTTSPEIVASITHALLALADDCARETPTGRLPPSRDREP